MDLVTNNAALHGFAPDIHDVYATVEDLELKRGWRPYNTLALPDDPPLAPAVTTWISGKARLRNDKLAVIGSKAQSASQLKFSLSSFKDWAARSAEWAEELAKYGDPLDALKEASREPDPDRLWQYTSNVYKAFTARPPTLTLRHHDRNEEIGITEGWDLHCLVPAVVFDAIAMDLDRDRCEVLDLVLQLCPTLVDDPYARSTDRVTVGILRLGEFDSGTGRGWLEHLAWTSGSLQNGRGVRLPGADAENTGEGD